MDARKERIKYEKMSKNYDRIYLVSFILLIVLVCSSVIIIGATGGKYGVFYCWQFYLTHVLRKNLKKYEQYSNKGRI